LNDVPQTVLWSINAPIPPGVTINQNGLVRLTNNVADGTVFTVKVTSLYDQTKFAEIVITASTEAP
jgi:hypothetical protein